MSLFTPEQVAKLSAEIDTQLQLIQQSGEARSKQEPFLAAAETIEYAQLRQQRQTIEQVTEQDPDDFLTLFAQQARHELCEADGLLYKQWNKWSDLTNDDVVKRFSEILVVMGFTAAPLELLVVSVGVIVLRLGVKTFCQKYSQSP